MVSGYTMHRINNVAARVVWMEHGYEFYHPDCLAEIASDQNISEENVSIDHEYCGGDGRFTRYDDECAGCGNLLEDSGGIQPEDEQEEEEQE